MCGFAGLAQRYPDEAAAERFRALAFKSLARRGPDAAESAVIGGVELIHTRLSIIDVEGGRQPMEDEAGAIAFNGEVYNHAELRQPNTLYKTRSDTEALLKGLNTQGIDFLNRADGMFAFAYFNKAQRKIYVARDAFGIKPAYFIAKPGVFAFSSTMPALTAFSDKTINPQAYLQYYLSRAARGANTIFSDIHEVAPGHVAVFDLDTFTVEVKRWLKQEPVAVSTKREADLLDDLDQILNFAVRRHLIADVPVASLLSGGIDSGLLTAIAARYVPDLACFSIGFKDERYDESPYSQAVARKYGLRHYVKFVDGDDLVGMMEDWPTIADDASAEPASVMRYLVSQFARDSGFKVVLSGEGADEFFGGYHQYFRFQLARKLNAVGRFFPFVDGLARTVLWPKSRLAHHLLQVAGEPEYHGTSMIFEPHMMKEVFVGYEKDYPVAKTLKQALFLDQRHRLPDDMLTITDRSTMHASIEARVPFITRYVADFAASLPEDMILKGKHKKYLLRQLALKYLPEQCVTRRKVGFDMPLGRWLRNELRPLVEDALANTWQRAFLKPGAMERVVAAHMSGKADFADKIWAFITLERNVRALKAMA
jgi:asparagine synthase (glutamine-hydrolysing)